MQGGFHNSIDESFKMVKYCFKVPKAMNRVTVPTILAATVLVAGMFALMPVEKAQTSHISISAQDRAMTWDISNLAIAEIVTLVPGVAGKDMSGRATVNGVAGTNTCTVEDDDGTDIAAAAAVDVAAADFNTAGAGTPAGFVTGDGIQLLNGVATGQCKVTLYFQTLEP